MRKVLLFTLLVISTATLHAQMPVGGMRAGARLGGQNMNVGHLYGKVINSSTNKGVEGASILLLGRNIY